MRFSTSTSFCCAASYRSLDHLQRRGVRQEGAGGLTQHSLIPGQKLLSTHGREAQGTHANSKLPPWQSCGTPALRLLLRSGAVAAATSAASCLPRTLADSAGAQLPVSACGACGMAAAAGHRRRLRASRAKVGRVSLPLVPPPLGGRLLRQGLFQVGGSSRSLALCYCSCSSVPS